MSALRPAVLRARRHQNGRWPMNRALRVLAWHEGFEAPKPSESGRASA